MPSDGSAGRSPETDEELEAREAQRRAQARQARPRMNVEQIHSWVDLEIQQALRRGEFENLPGAGKPLKDLENSDPDWWVKGLIEREKLDMSAALPTVLALRQERRGFPGSLAGMSDEVAVRERLEDYNARVIEDRRKPVIGPNSPAIAGRVDVDEMLEQWRKLRADRARPLTDPDAAGAQPAPTVRSPQAGSTPRVTRVVAVLMLIGIVLVVLVWAAF